MLTYSRQDHPRFASFSHVDDLLHPPYRDDEFRHLQARSHIIYTENHPYSWDYDTLPHLWQNLSIFIKNQTYFRDFPQFRSQVFYFSLLLDFFIKVILNAVKNLMYLTVILSETKDLMHIVSFWGFSRGDFLPPFGKGGWGDICHSEAKPKNPVSFILVILSDSEESYAYHRHSEAPPKNLMYKSNTQNSSFPHSLCSVAFRMTPKKTFQKISQKNFFYIYNIMSYPHF